MMKKITILLFSILILSFAFKAKAALGDIGRIEPAWDSSITDTLMLVARIINWFLGIVGTLAFLAIIYSGFVYITAGPDTAKAEAAKKTLTWAITGVILAGLAYLIVYEILIQVPRVL